MPVITLRYTAICRECQAYLAPGTKVRYYGPGPNRGIYGLDCHGQKPKTVRGETKPDSPESDAL